MRGCTPLQFFQTFEDSPIHNIVTSVYPQGTDSKFSACYTKSPVLPFSVSRKLISEHGKRIKQFEVIFDTLLYFSEKLWSLCCPSSETHARLRFTIERGFPTMNVDVLDDNAFLTTRTSLGLFYCMQPSLTCAPETKLHASLLTKIKCFLIKYLK